MGWSSLTMGYSHMAETLLINGQWRASRDNGTLDVTNPANGAVIRTISKGTVQDVQAALEAADAAFPVWGGMSARERAAIMHAAMDICIRLAIEAVHRFDHRLGLL